MDKDRSGSIELDIKEVRHKDMGQMLLLYSRWAVADVGCRVQPCCRLEPPDVQQLCWTRVQTFFLSLPVFLSQWLQLTMYS